MILGSVNVILAQNDSTTSPITADSLSPFTTIKKKQKKPTTKLSTEFKHNQLTLEAGEIASNLLKITNNTKGPLPFWVTISAPNGWKATATLDKKYTLDGGDSIFIPVRIIPPGLISGNTTYYINAFITDEEDVLITRDNFYAVTHRIVSWEIYTEPSNNIYFRNGESEVDFQLGLLNTGNFDQDILMSLKNARNDLVITDTAYKNVNLDHNTVSLDSRQDTIFHLKARTIRGVRNFRTVSTLSHHPCDEGTGQRYSLFLDTREPRPGGIINFSKGAKVNLIKLPRSKAVTPYKQGVVPLEVTGNVQNIFGDFTFFTLNMRGNKRIDSTTYMLYNTQFNFVSPYFNRKLLNRVPWYVGYFAEKYQVQAGQINGGVLGLQNSGIGLKGQYEINKQHKVGAFILRAPGVFQNRVSTSFGLKHQFDHELVRVRSNYGRSYHHIRNSVTDVLSTQANSRLFEKHNVSFMGAVSLFHDRDFNPGQRVFGYQVGVTYSSRFFNKRMATNALVRYNPETFGSSGTKRFIGNGRISYVINDKWSTFVSTNYNRSQRFINSGSATLAQPVNTIFFNQVNFITRHGSGSIQPNAFYNYSNIVNNRLHSRGIGIRVTKNDFTKNLLLASDVRAGYNKAVDFNMPNFFIFQFGTLLKVKTTSLNARYFYGPNSVSGIQLLQNGGVTPQAIRLSLQNQYMFNDSRFILQTGATYGYNNQFKSHSFTFLPEIFYFNYTGWRFSINASFNVNSNDFQSRLPAAQSLNPVFSESGPNVNRNLTFGCSIHKEFGIPIPYSKVENHTMEFVAFFDTDGDRVKSKNEPSLDNVIVRVDRHEVITDRKGEAEIENIPKGEYKYSVTSLDDLKGWFPDIPAIIDVVKTGKVYIPFVRGVKIGGDVILHREKLAADSDEKFDLSNIKITAMSENGDVYETLTNFNGSFEFYVPNGNYTITMDENIFNTTRFALAQNNIPLELNDQSEKVYITFFIAERIRKVNRKKF